jgi:hypothetical protein
MNANQAVHEYLSMIGSRGGKKHKITHEQAVKAGQASVIRRRAIKAAAIEAARLGVAVAGIAGMLAVWQIAG